jgi:hypothetical protein
MSERRDIPIACDLTAIPADVRQQHIEEELRVFQSAQAVQELENGYAFRFAPEMLLPVAQMVENERRCCPFFAFTLELAPGGGPLWLRLTGDEGVKEFTRTLVADAQGSLESGLIKTGEDQALAQSVVQSMAGWAEVMARATFEKP